MVHADCCHVSQINFGDTGLDPPIAGLNDIHTVCKLLREKEKKKVDRKDRVDKPYVISGKSQIPCHVPNCVHLNDMHLITTRNVIIQHVM